MISVASAIERFEFSYRVAWLIRAIWEWPVMTAEEMGNQMNLVRSKREGVAAAEAEATSARAVLEEEMRLYRGQIRDFLRLAKLRFRAARPKHALVRPLRLRGTGRQQTLDLGRKIDQAWNKLDPGWEPLPGLTRTALQTCAGRCVSFLDAYLYKETEWQDKLGELQEFAAQLDRLSVEWYATATARFLAGTRYGDLIRVMVPTTGGGVQPVEQAVIDELSSPTGGTARLVFHAPHATLYRLWHKGPGAAEWTVLADAVEGLIYEATGLVEGEHRFQVAGRNSSGEGPGSAEALVGVAAAVAA
jgi:hypothetical protein